MRKYGRRITFLLHKQSEKARVCFKRDVLVLATLWYIEYYQKSFELADGLGIRSVSYIKSRL